eukprot:228075-Amphidinium_carterae.1
MNGIQEGMGRLWQMCCRRHPQVELKTRPQEAVVAVSTQMNQNCADSMKEKGAGIGKPLSSNKRVYWPSVWLA